MICAKKRIFEWKRVYRCSNGGAYNPNRQDGKENLNTKQFTHAVFYFLDNTSFSHILQRTR